MSITWRVREIGAKFVRYGERAKKEQRPNTKCVRTLSGAGDRGRTGTVSLPLDFEFFRASFIQGYLALRKPLISLDISTFLACWRG